MRGGGRETELELRGGGWTEGRAFIIIHVLILKTFPVFNARSCFNEYSF